jgi:hypothetical protein
MTSPGWMRWLPVRLAPPGKAEDVVGNLEETYRARRLSHGRVQALPLTAVAALEMAAALVGEGRAPLSDVGATMWLEMDFTATNRPFAGTSKQLWGSSR